MSLRWKIAQAFEIRWWQHYLRNKPKKNYLEWKRDYWETFLRDIKVTPKANSRAIDIGCGPAGIYMVLDQLRIDALDPLLSNYREKLFRMIPGDILHPHQYDLPEYRKMLTDRNCELLSSVLYRRETIFNYYVLVAQKAAN